MRLIIFTILAATSATAFAQPGSYQLSQPTPTHLTQPPRVNANTYADALQRNTLHDYEVWIAKDTSKTVSYLLHVKTSHGWDVVGEASGSGFYVQDRLFESQEAALIYLDYLELVSSSKILDYYLEPIIWNMQWEYVATFDKPHQAREFLDMLLDVIGDEYVGQIKKIRVLPKSLQ